MNWNILTCKYCNDIQSGHWSVGPLLGEDSVLGTFRSLVAFYGVIMLNNRLGLLGNIVREVSHEIVSK